MSGTLRLGHIDGLSKIILNGVASSKYFYVNGDGEISSNLLVASLDSSGYIKGLKYSVKYIQCPQYQ